MICPLCRKREGNKKNTHYLTDGIIRPCLNFDGGNERETGLYFDMSEIGHVEFNFQRNTSIDTLEKELKRPPTDEEIERAKKNPYAVDGVFCSECEALFSKIENEFISKVLPEFRGAELGDKTVVPISDIKLARLFWYLQLWRSAICVSGLKITFEAKETIREFILQNETVSLKSLTSFPLLVTYLETSGGNEQLTTNFVGFVNEANPLYIFMCDFVIQFFESPETKPREMHGLNVGFSAEQLNYRESTFQVKVLSNKDRKTFIEQYRKTDSDERIKHYAKSFSRLWSEVFKKPPTNDMVKEFISELTDNPEENILHYSKENILRITIAFIQRKARR